MKIKNTTFLLLLFGLSIAVFSQPSSELQTFQKKYPGVPAVIINENVEYHFEIIKDSLYIYEKDYTETFYLQDVAGYWKDYQIGYSGFSEIKDIEAKTLVPGKKGYKPIKVKLFKQKDELSNAIFYDDIKYITFTYEELQKGSKSELSYIRTHKDPHIIGREFLQSSIPIEHKTISIIADDRIDIGIGKFNLDKIDFEFTTKKEKGKTIYTWEVNQIEGIKDESGAPSIAWYGPHIIPYVKSYSINGELHPVLRDPNDLFSWYNSFVAKLNKEEKDPQMQILVDSITNGAETDLEKVKRIFYWTQDNIKYIAIEYGMGGFVPRDANFVCTNRYGDCKDMASTITNLLDYAGINAHLTWIGTNDIPYTYEELPTPNVDNHMIATYIDADSNYYFLDATGRYSIFGLPSSFILGKEALIKKNATDYEIVTVPIIEPKQNRIREKIKLSIDNKSLKGNALASINGYNKTRFQYNIEDKTNEDKLKFYNISFTKGHNKFILTDFTEKNLYPSEKPLEISYNFYVDDYIMTNKNEMYINMNLDDLISDQKIKKDRENPIQYKYPQELENTIELEIPEGWSVDYLPENLSIESPFITYESNYKIKQGKIILYQKTELHQLNMSKAHFSEWNTNVSKIVKHQNEIVILKQNND